jgi:hypothetical protein
VESLNISFNYELTVRGLASVCRCEHLHKVQVSICRDRPRQVQGHIVDCLSGDSMESASTSMTLRQLTVRFVSADDSSENVDGDVDEEKEWVQRLLVSGFEKNASLHKLTGVLLSIANEHCIESFLHRNRFNAYANSLDVAVLDAS